MGLQRHLTSKNKCWANVCSLSSNRCILNWREKLLECCWRSTTQNWSICWNVKNRSRVKLKKPWLYSRLTKLSHLSKNKFARKKKKILSFFRKHFKKRKKERKLSTRKKEIKVIKSLFGTFEK